jgi:Flp pilus assembly protein CpaB
VKKSAKGYPFTQTLFRDIRVIAVDRATSATGATPAKTLTLELTPFQTEAMSLAQSMGGIEFTLRSIVPEQDDDSILQDEDGGLLAQVGLGRSDGVEKGALLGPELLAVAKEKPVASSNILPAGSSAVKINIVRGTATQTVKVKKH